VIALRGATTVAVDTPEAIAEATLELMDQLMAANTLQKDKMISILFSVTSDVKSAYPGKFLRTARGMGDVPLLHFQEMQVEGSLQRCIRVMIHYQEEKKPIHVYLRGAKILRPDLSRDSR